ncbi:MAG: FAD-dependent oxidoreductase [Anaerolineae bacterium]|nr:FAD-dependent oxidoreductase [Anaerolineae bacterium]
MMQVKYENTFLPHSGPAQARLIETASNGGREGEGRSGVLSPRDETPSVSLRSISEAEHILPVIGEVEVLVCGGGPAGTAAAIAAARTGAKTLLVEQYGYLGGMSTAGLVTPHFDPFLNKGLNQELIERLITRKAWGAPFWRITFDPEQLKMVSEDMVLESGSDLLYHTFAVAAILEDNRMRGAVIETKSGRFAVLAKVVIDCTGDGDIAARAGAPFEKGRPGDHLLQPMTMMFRMGGLQWVQTNGTQLLSLVQKAIEATGEPFRLAFERPWAIHLPNPGEVAVQLVHIRGVDATDARDLTLAEIEGRRQTWAVVDFLVRHVPEFENAYLIETAAQVGVRESRRIMGDYLLTLDDVRKGRKFDDGIATVSFGVDIHDPVGKSQIGGGITGVYDIPYGCLVPRDIEGLLVAGRCISGTHEAHASYRVKGPCVAMGQAAGTAAALATRFDVLPRGLDASALRQELIRQGVELEATERPNQDWSTDLNMDPDSENEWEVSGKQA